MSAGTHYAAKRREWRSGFCGISLPVESHRRCSGHSGKSPCACICHRENRTPNGETMTDLVTPTGVLVYDGDPHTPEWFAARREGITGTDLPKILGLTKYGNALSVWMDKRGELEDEAGEAALWGTVLEDPVAQVWARRHGTTVYPVGVIANHGDTWMRASLDRLIVSRQCPDEPGAFCGLEVKTRNAYVRGSWSEDVPDDVLAQVTWGLHVTGLDHMHVATLIGGQELLTFRVNRDEQIEKYLRDAAERVWEAVLNGFPPETHPDAEGVLLAQLNKMYGARAGERELDPTKASEWLAMYAEGNDLERQGKALKTTAKTGLVQLLDDGDTGLVDGAPAFTYKASDPAPTLTAAEMKRLRTERADVYAELVAEGFITTSKPSPRFNLKKESK